MDTGNAKQLSAEAAEQLQQGIGLLLSRWTALQMAVAEGWGGRDSHEKSQQLHADIFSFLTQSKEPLYIDDLEDMLFEFMLSLNTEIGDGSLEEVAEKLMVMHEECLQGNYQSIEILRGITPPRDAVAYVRQPAGDDDDDSSDDDGSDDGDGRFGNDDSSEMVVDFPESKSNVSQQDMTVDDPRLNDIVEVEDGWTVVGSRRNRNTRRN